MDSNNPKIWILIAAIIVIIAVAWFMFGRPERLTAPSETTSDASLQKLETLSSSDEVLTLEQELNATDFSNLASELEAISREFGE